MTDTTTQLVILLWIGVIASGWLLLQRNRDRSSDDERSPIVGVQKHGRIHYVRKDLLDSFDTVDYSSRPTTYDASRRAAAPSDRDGRDQRQHSISVAALAAIATLLVGIVLFGQ